MTKKWRVSPVPACDFFKIYAIKKQMLSISPILVPFTKNATTKPV